MRFLLICLATVFVCGLGFLAVRSSGEATPYQAFEHDFWSGSKPYLAVRASSAKEVEELRQHEPEAILWFDIYETQDGHLIVLNPTQLKALLQAEAWGPERWRGPFLYRYPLDQLRVLDNEIATLEEVLNLDPHGRLILNVVNSTPTIQTSLAKMLENRDPDRRLLIQSDTDAVIRQFKEDKPVWLYGSSRADLVRWLSFESIGLVSVTPFRGDAFIGELKVKGRTGINEGVIAEIHRRQKKALLGPLYDSTEVQEARRLGADGFILDSLRLLPLFKPATP